MKQFHYEDFLSPQTVAGLENNRDIDAMLYFSDGTVGRGYLVLQYEIPVTGRKVLLFTEDRRNADQALLIYPVLLSEVQGGIRLTPADAPEMRLLKEDVAESLQGVIAETSRGFLKKRPIMAADPKKQLLDIQVIG